MDKLLQVAVERGLADTHHSRRQKLVLIELGNRAQDSPFFQGAGKGPSPPESGNLLLQVSPVGRALHFGKSGRAHANC